MSEPVNSAQRPRAEDEDRAAFDLGPMTVDEYRAFQLTCEGRHEYVDGMVFAMSGASRRHNRIVMNIARRLLDAADGGPCHVYVEAVRVRVAETVFYYPDVATSCDEEMETHELHSPCLVVETLSPSTSQTDRREKLIFYRRKPSVRMCLIVYQDRRLVQCHRRVGGDWQLASYTENDEVIPVDCPETTLSVAQIYAGVEGEGGGPLLPGLRRVHEAAPR